MNSIILPKSANKGGSIRSATSGTMLAAVACMLTMPLPCRAAHPWLTVRTNTNGSAPVAVADLTANGTAEFDLVVGMDSVPGPGPDRDQWERIFSHWSNAIFEATEGAHRIRRVRVFSDYSNVWRGLPVDVIVEKESTLNERPNSPLNGLWRSSDRIWMCELWNFKLDGEVHSLSFVKNGSAGEKAAGYTLAHEWGHYAYGLGDEYRRKNLELGGCVLAWEEEPVEASIMCNQIKAALAAEEDGIDPMLYLNYSIARTELLVSPLESNFKTLQYGLHKASCWETLGREVADDEPNWCPAVETARRSFGELRAVAIPPGSEPKVQLTTMSLEPPENVWMERDRMVMLVLDKSGSMTERIGKAKAALQYVVRTLERGRDWVGIVAFDSAATVLAEPVLLDSETVVDSLVASLDPIAAGGGTSIRAGVAAAVSSMSPATHRSKLRAVYLVTDGRDEAVLNAVGPARDAQIPVFAMSFGDASGADGLRSLCRMTGGGFSEEPGLAEGIIRFIWEHIPSLGADPIGDGFATIVPGASGGGSVFVEAGTQRLVVELVGSRPAGEMPTLLLGPGGQQVQPLMVEDMAGETAARFEVQQPQAGTWSLRVSNQAVTNLRVQFLGRQINPGEPLQLIPLPIEDPAERPIRLRVCLNGSTPMTGAVVEGHVVSPAGIVTQMVFRDDGTAGDAAAGDGIYTGLLQQTESGPHTVLAKADNRAGTMATSHVSSLSALPDGSAGDPPTPQLVNRTFERTSRMTVECLAPGAAPTIALEGTPQLTPFFSAAIQVSDSDTPKSLLRVSVRSTNPTLLPDSLLNARTEGASNRWRITAAPVVRTVGGSVGIEVTVSDGYSTAVRLFNWTFGVDPGEEYLADGTPTGGEEEMRWLVNRLRYDPQAENIRRGSSYTVPAGPLPPLAPNALLTTAARRHSEDLATTNTFAHESPVGSKYYVPGSSLGTRLTAEGYQWSGYAENIAVGYTTPTAAHIGLFHSAGHRENMLRDYPNETGMGTCQLAGSTYVRYYTQDFAVRSGGGPFFTGTLFRDANTDGSYQAGEGVGGVRIQLQRDGAVFRYFDTSAPAGSFAIPLSALSGGPWEVVAIPPAGGPVEIDLPFTGGNGLRRVTLTGGKAARLGWLDATLQAGGCGLEVVAEFGQMLSSVGPSLPFAIQGFERLAANQWRLSFPSQVGKTYRIQQSLDLVGWDDLESGIPGTGSFITRTPVAPEYPERNRFFRVIEE